MRNVIEIIQRYYVDCSVTTPAFEKQLKGCPKDDLVEFIMAMQARGAFGGRLVHE